MSASLEKLAKAQEAAKAVEKKGRNKEQGYDFVRAVDVVAIAREALHGAGLFATFTIGEPILREVTSKSGTGGLFVSLTGTLAVYDSENGDGAFAVVTTPGTGIDYPGDKAVYKAITGASKYAHALVLDLPFGEDPEQDGSHNDAREAAPSAAAADGEAKPPSPKQMEFLERLLKKGDLGDDLPSLLSYASANLTGGREGSASKLIDELMDDDQREERTAAFREAATAWAGEQTDMPLDDAGLESAEAS